MEVALPEPTILRADARSLPLADNSVDLIVTSPPYFALRSYQDGGEHYADQVGAEITPREYLDTLLDVTEECVRVLKPTGSLWINLGDKYAGGGGFSPNAPSNIARRNGAPSTFGGARNEHTRQRGAAGRGARWGLPAKSLLGIPWRYAIRCTDELGLILRAEVIWAKPNALPESVKDRVRRAHETWFHFTLQPNYYTAVDEIREPYVAPSVSRRTWDERKASGVTWTPGVGTRGTHLGAHETPNSNMSGSPLGRVPGSVWSVATQPLKVPGHLGVDHFAAFPMELPRRIILGWSPREVCTACGQGRSPVTQATKVNRHGAVNRPTRGRVTSVAGQPDRREGARLASCATITGYACACPDITAPTTPGVVLDPFGGTGTTALVASVHDRHGISVDASADYCRLAQWRTNDPGQRTRATGAKPRSAPRTPTPQPTLF